MKKLMLVISVLYSYSCSFAQDGFFVRGQAGAGSTKYVDISRGLNDSHPACDCGYDLGAKTTNTSVDINGEVGYQYKRVRLITGLQMVSTGNLKDASFVSFPSGKTYTSPIIDVYQRYNHVLIPLNVAFKISLHGRSSLYPELGTRLVFLADNNKLMNSTDIKGRFFSAKLSYEYAFSQHLSLVVSPAYYSIIAPVYYTPAADYNSLFTFNHVLMVQAGVLWHLSHKGKQSETGIANPAGEK